MNILAAQKIALRLQRAKEASTLANPTGLEGLTLEAAYSVNDASRALAVTQGERVVGYKIGLTSTPAQQVFAATAPAFGYLLESTVVPSGETVSTAGLNSAAVEVEIAFRLRSPLASAEVTAHDVMDATESIAPALEIVGSRWQSGPANLPMLVADNTNAAAVVLGKWSLLSGDLSQSTSTLEISGRSIPGAGVAVLGNPCEAVAWLARQLVHAGTPLEAEQIVMSGTFSAPVLLEGAHQVSAEISGLGDVSVQFN